MNFKPQRKGRGLIINVTSLIDVMFLLLIFFMVSSTFKDQPAINLVLPRSATATETPAAPTVLYLTQAGEVYLNDTRVKKDELADLLKQLQAETGEDTVVLRSDEKAELGDVVALIDTVKKSGFTGVSISARVATQ